MSNPQVLYAADNEGPTLMRLETLIGNFNETGGWQFRHNESDMRHEVDSRGWYEGLHENGHYLVLNVDKFQLMPHPSLYDRPGAVAAELGGASPAPIAPDALPKSRTNFFQWFDGVTTRTAQTSAGAFMSPRGFRIAHTGGGCLAWEKAKPDSVWAVWIVDEDAGLGDDLGDKFETSATFGAMLQTQEGVFINGPQESTIADCIAWAESMLAKSDDELNATAED